MDKKLMDCGYYVCSIISDTINKRTKVNISDFNDTETIKSFAKIHNLQSILGCIDNKTEFHDAMNNAIFKQMKFDIMCDNIGAQLSKAKIKHIVLKGSEIQKFYPDNIIRDTSDIDIYVNEADIPNVDKIMTDNGFSLNYQDNQEYKYIKKPRYNIEFHTSLEGFNTKEQEILLKLVDNAVQVNDYRYALNDSDCYIHTLFHLYKHFIISGVGVRMFLDIYMIRKFGKIDFYYTKEILEKLGILGFEQTVCEINDVLFENKVPTDDINEVIEFVFNSGIYGTKQINLHLSRINYATKSTSKIKWFFTYYGIGFKAMSERYPVLCKAPILYPFSLIHRLFYGLIHKKDVIEKEKKINKSISSQRIKKYKRIFEIAKIKM